MPVVRRHTVGGGTSLLLTWLDPLPWGVTMTKSLAPAVSSTVLMAVGRPFLPMVHQQSGSAGRYDPEAVHTPPTQAPASQAAPLVTLNGECQAVLSATRPRRCSV